MTFIIVSTEVEVHNIGGADPSGEPYTQRDSTSGHVTNVSASVKPEWDTKDHYSYGESWGGELDVVKGGTVWAVVADYSSGDSFGRDGGHSQVVEVFTDPVKADEFIKVAGQIRPSEYSWRRDYEYSFEYEGKTYRRDWAGYFEDLQSLDIWELTVGGSTAGYGYKRGR